MDSGLYIPLRVCSHYSFGKSNIKLHEVVELASGRDIPAMCLADYFNMFGAMEFALSCASVGIQPITGCIINVDFSPYFFPGEDSSQYWVEMLVIARKKVGYSNIVKLVTDSHLLVSTSDKPHVKVNALLDRLDGLIVLFNPFNPAAKRILNDGKIFERVLKDFAHLVQEDNFFIEVLRDSPRTGLDFNFEKEVINTAYKYAIPIVGTSPICFLKEDGHEASDALLCIVEGTYILQDDRNRINKEHYFKTQRQMAKLFSDLPEAIENTALIARKCSFFLEKLPHVFPKFSDNPNEEADLLRRNAREGLESRISLINDVELKQKYFDRLNYELDVIVKTSFHSYFLIVADLIAWSKKQNIVVGPGRGSAAGCLVAWALSITDIDPIKFGLIFERFLNPGRVSLPDLDIDFCKLRRDEVIEYVQSRYGLDKVAHIITFGTLQPRAALRDVGRVLQLPYSLVNKICQFVPNNPANPINLAQAIELEPYLRDMQKTDPNIDKLLKIGLALEGCIKHASKHAAGIVISAEPLDTIIPLYKDDNSSIPIVQYSMKYAEAVGLIKFDFLGLKTLTVIAEACALIEEYDGIKLDVKKLSLDDKKTYEMFSSGCNVGIFQFERSGIKDAIKGLKPDCIEDVIALGSLNRPGPMENIPHYIRRKHNLEPVTYIHPILEPILRETYGIIVYQEQVLEIANVFAQYTLIEAEFLRRSMGKKDKKEMSLQKDKFINKAIESGHERDLAVEIFELVSKFASYGFNKSHAAAYAVISYYTAYLKAHHLVEFMVASINLEIDNSLKVGILCNEAKLLHVSILPPCINKSDAFFTIEIVNGVKNIRFGLGAIKNVGIKISEEIVAERKSKGTFENIISFFERTVELGLNKKMIEAFAKANVFHSIYGNPAKIFDNANEILKYVQKSNDRIHNDTFDILQGSLFQMGQGAPKPRISENPDFSDSDQLNIHGLRETLPWNEKEKVQSEYDAIGFYLTEHPLSQYSKQMTLYNVISSNAFFESSREEIEGLVRIAGVIVSISVRSMHNKNKSSKYAFVTLSDTDGMLETCIFDEDLIFSKKDILAEGAVVLCKVSFKQGGNRIVIEDIMRMDDAVNFKRVVVYINDVNCISLIKEKITASKGLGIDVQFIVNGDGRDYHFTSVKILQDCIYDMLESEGLKIEVIE